MAVWVNRKIVILSVVKSCAKAREITKSKDPYSTEIVAGNRGPSTPQ
jgi:hypothetical protein